MSCRRVLKSIQALAAHTLLLCFTLLLVLKLDHTPSPPHGGPSKELGMPDGVLFNGKGPYKYNSNVLDGIQYETVNVDPGETYRIRVHNVGISTSLNLRIQNQRACFWSSSSSLN